jgi:hypothetical protein
VAPQQADVRAQVKVTAPQRDLAFMEWEIPAEVMVAELHGRDVRNWSRTGPRLQIWFRRSLAQATLELTGWLARPANKPKEPFVLPCLTFPGATPHTTFVRVVAERGWTLHPDQLQNLVSLPEPRPIEDDRNYLSTQALYRGLFHLRPAAARADLQALSLVEIRERRITFSALLDYEIGRRKARTLTVRLGNWKGQEVRLEAPQRINRRELPDSPLARTWVLELPPTLTGHLQCQILGTLGRDGSPEFAMPEVSVAEAASSERWLAALGPELRHEQQHGLIAADTDVLQSRWPAVAQRLRQLGGSVWKITAADWKLHLRTDSPLVEARPVQIFLDEQAAGIVDGRRWLHEATYWLYQESGTHLGIRLPNEATLVTASLDGNDINLLPAGTQHLWLPLTGGGGMRVFRLRWVYNGNRELLDQPRMDRPHLENTLYPSAEKRSPTLWTVHLPPGYHLAQPAENARPGNTVERFLDRAAAELLATGLLAEHTAEKAGELHDRQLLATQARFYWYCREAEYELASPFRPRETAVGLDHLTARLKKLHADNEQLARTHYFDMTRAQAEAQTAPRARMGTGRVDRPEAPNGDGLLGQQGTPTYWHAADDQREPRLRLVRVQTEQTRQAFGYSGIVLIFFLVGWILPYYPRVLAWVQAFWPEQMMLLGGLGWLVRGENLAVAFVLLIGVAARLVYLGRWIALRWRRPAPASAGSGVSSAT